MSMFRWKLIVLCRMFALSGLPFTIDIISFTSTIHTYDVSKRSVCWHFGRLVHWYKLSQLVIEKRAAMLLHTKMLLSEAVYSCTPLLLRKYSKDRRSKAYCKSGIQLDRYNLVAGEKYPGKTSKLITFSFVKIN